ncbi:nucleotide-binding universal stress UspA family protein [Isoptericola sp. CG 20/1183]|uniref:Nucleotide-binding universal stress UspA family protein n=1 Tax=Isoptericola halotolerans TaxID=300560 RepID=A0ABX5E9Y8_9MICO|nr:MULTISPECIES: universal stress protein [Isoptericola]PRZ03223.1 nucleotide-binding universal stress UspA family protein [Isoptericola sp. CG 20/1183]PRZ03565.1 nucleotide-binding universal stress UspA family protein [Isoptericola halotolerans]
MGETWPGGIVVGVDGSPESYHAFDWALAAAERHHAALQVMYAEPVPLGPVTPVPAYRPEEIWHESQRVLRRAVDRVDARTRGSVPVTAVPAEGGPTSALVASSRDADLVVVGRRGAAATRHLLGSVSSVVASRAHGPVAVVPTRARAGPPNRVVVGVGFDDDPTAMLDLAFAEAQSCRCPVVLLHAVPPSSRVAREAGSARDEDVQAALRGLAYRWGTQYPDVDCRLATRSGGPVAALLEEVTPSDLLVLGGHRHLRVVGRLLGSVPDVLLGDAPCVVAVTHTTRPHVTDE